MRRYALLGLLLMALLLALSSTQPARAQSTSTPTATATSTATATATSTATSTVTATATSTITVTPAIWYRGVTTQNQGYQVKYSVDLGDIVLFVGQLAVVALAVGLLLADRSTKGG